MSLISDSAVDLILKMGEQGDIDGLVTARLWAGLQIILLQEDQSNKSCISLENNDPESPKGGIDESIQS